MNSDSTRIWNRATRGGLAGFICLLGLLTSVHGGPIQLGSTNVNTGVSFSIPLTVDSGNQPLGSYSVDFNFDTNVIRITGIAGGAAEFSATPGTINTNNAGQVILIGQQTSSLTSPTGVTLVAQISFTAIGSPGSNSSLAFNSASAIDANDGSEISITTSNGLVSINWIPPTADFSGAPTNGLVPLIVAFTNSSSGSITNSFWNFGDGDTTNTTDASLSHTYSVAGTYSVTLIADGPAGSSTNTQSNYITALDPPQLVVNPGSLNFGSVIVGQSNSLNFSVINTGDATLSGTATSATPFSVTSGTNYNVAGGQTQTVTVAFAPSSTGAFTDSVIFASDGGDSTNTVIGAGALVPVASFTGSPTTGTVSLAVTFTDSSTGTITNRFWNFGDGSTSNTVATSVAYTYTAAGTRTVSLTVFGPVGTNVQTRNNYIVVQTLPQLVVSPASRDYGSVTIGLTNSLNFSVINTGEATLTGTATSAAPFSVTGGGNYSVSGGQTQTVTVAFAPSSAVASTGSVIFASDGGDSTNTVTGAGLTPGSMSVTPASQDFGTVATGATAFVSFVVTNSGGTSVSNGTAAVSGPFTVVTNANFSVAGFGVTDVVVQFAPVSVGPFTNNVAFGSANGGVATNTVIGTGAIVPVASFTANPTTGGVPLAVTFTDASSGTITNRFWDFGDGNTTNTAATSIDHTYNVAGSNTVSLTVSGPVGTDTQTRTDYIALFDPPVASFSGTPTLGGNPLPVTFTDSSSGTITNRSWDFGDGSTTNTTSTSVSYTYPLEGTNSVSLTVFGPGGLSTTSRLSYIIVTNVIVDATPPQLQVISPTDYQAFATNDITISGTASDTNGISSVTVNGVAATLNVTNWSRALTLSVGTNTLNVIATDNSPQANTATQVVHAVFVPPTNNIPVITAGPLVTNALLQAGAVALVVVDETNTFLVSASDADSDTLSYRWDFGDGSSTAWLSANTVTHAYSGDCGPYAASVMVTDGTDSTNSAFTVAVACQMQVTKLQLKLKFNKSSADAWKLTADTTLPDGFSPDGKLVALDVAGAQVAFTLDAKGRGVNSQGSCRLSFNKKTSAWEITAKLKNGDWQTAWADYGLVNADVPKNTATVTVPVNVLIGDEGFAGESTLIYSAKAGKAGKAK